MNFFFFRNPLETKAGRLVSELILFFKKALYEVNTSGMQFSFNKFR